MPTIRLATRGSAQASTQSEHVAQQLRRAGFDAELVVISTHGDRTQADGVPLHTIGGQGVFVKEVQVAVLDGRADLAVHSAKDLPSTPHDGLMIGAFTERRSAADALIGRSLVDLPAGATVATGSVRRRAQLRRARPDLDFVELRGNIHTRLDRVPDGGAVVMAVAALEVLGLTDRIADRLDTAEFVPAVGQGCVAVECRVDDDRMRDALEAVDHAPTRAEVEVERAFLAELGSGCSLPVGAHVDAGKLFTFLADEASGVTVSDTIELVGDVIVDRERARQAAAAALAFVSEG
ncbi:MAG: hydroxymethylbilane synthase [Ilumatobacter sp.]|uniref:hydroxymethylbilane synthase n=1 Tax=Ilumatobacter sp. TaxID=1967498 RepID=UPI002603F20E|nr:hydroxymethylbilane synthase [Ilumatobacter sp.]MDJ0767403.1 hydroxymethylbilane synthase [Ilumatobacter sp.]